jgi:hypothetical protein
MAANFVGTYSSGAGYVRGQWVVESEGLYACLQPSKGNAPVSSPLFWALIGAVTE